MKRSVTILLTLMGIFMIGMAFAALSQVDVPMMAQTVKANAHYAMVPLVISPAITEDLIRDLKIKFGMIKVITIVVEPDEYDIDNLSFADRVYLKGLGIDVKKLINKSLSLDDRLESVHEYLSKSGISQTEKETVQQLASGRVLVPGEKYQFLVRRPDKGLVKMLTELGQKGSFSEFADSAVKNLVVGGDTEALENGTVFIGVVAEIKSMIGPAESFLSKV